VGPTSEELTEIKNLKAQVRDLREANEMAISRGQRTGTCDHALSVSGGNMVRGVLTHEQKQLALRLRSHGLPLVEIARQVGCTAPMVGLMVREGRFLTGLPTTWTPRPGRLTVVEREQVLLGLARGDSFSAIARGLGRAPSTVSREVKANGGRQGYRAWHAHQRARDPKLDAYAGQRSTNTPVIVLEPRHGTA
jgi:DNA-binding CsgD family transcriptional regulator